MDCHRVLEESEGVNVDYGLALFVERDSGRVVVEKVDFNKYLEKAFDSFIQVVSRSFLFPADIIKCLINDKNGLRQLTFNQFNHCKDFNSAYQQRKPLMILNERNWDRNYFVTGEDKLSESKKNHIRALSQRLVCLAFEAKQAYYLNDFYQKISSRENLVAYSHMKSGWSNPTFKYDKNLWFLIKTNFGYGKSSYFFTSIIYRELNLIHYVNLIYYEKSNLHEFVERWNEYELNNWSWPIVMEDIRQVVEDYLKGEEYFLKKYMYDQMNQYIDLINWLVDVDELAVLKSKTFINPNRMRTTLGVTHPFFQSLSEFKYLKYNYCVQLIKYFYLMASKFDMESYYSKLFRVMDAYTKIMKEYLVFVENQMVNIVKSRFILLELKKELIEYDFIEGNSNFEGNVPFPKVLDYDNIIPIERYKISGGELTHDVVQKKIKIAISDEKKFVGISENIRVSLTKYLKLRSICPVDLY